MARENHDIGEFTLDRNERPGQKFLYQYEDDNANAQ